VALLESKQTTGGSFPHLMRRRSASRVSCPPPCGSSFGRDGTLPEASELLRSARSLLWGLQQVFGFGGSFVEAFAPTAWVGCGVPQGLKQPPEVCHVQLATFDLRHALPCMVEGDFPLGLAL